MNAATRPATIQGSRISLASGPKEYQSPTASPSRARVSRVARALAESGPRRLRPRSTTKQSYLIASPSPARVGPSAPGPRVPPQAVPAQPVPPKPVPPQAVPAQAVPAQAVPPKPVPPQPVPPQTRPLSIGGRRLLLSDLVPAVGQREELRRGLHRRGGSAQGGVHVDDAGRDGGPGVD